MTGRIRNHGRPALMLTYSWWTVRRPSSSKSGGKVNEEPFAGYNERHTGGDNGTSSPEQESFEL